MDTDKYKNTMPYPDRSTFAQSVRDEIDNMPMTVIQRQQAYNQIKARVTEHLKPVMDAYHAEETRIHAVFLKDMEDEWMSEDLPKNVRDAIHSLAWDRGHSSGYSEVANCYSEIVEIAETAFRAGVKAGKEAP